MAAPGYEEGDYDAFLPEQAIDLGTSLTAYTAGSAWVNHLDGAPARSRSASSPTSRCSTATRSPGPPTEIGATRVLQTFVEGERVYASSDA